MFPVAQKCQSDSRPALFFCSYFIHRIADLSSGSGQLGIRVIANIHKPLLIICLEGDAGKGKVGVMEPVCPDDLRVMQSTFYIMIVSSPKKFMLETVRLARSFV